MADVEIRKTGIRAGRVALSTLMNPNANPDAMETLTDGRIGKTLVIQTMKEFGKEMVDFPYERTARLVVPNLREAGSAMRLRRIAPKLMTVNRYAIENGVVTDTARTATGLAGPNSTKSPNGWIAMTETSRDEHIPKKILSAGRNV